MGIFSEVKRRLSGKKFSPDEALTTGEVRNRSEDFVGEGVLVMAYYYPGGDFSSGRDYLSSQEIDFDDREKLYEHAPQMLPCTKLDRIEDQEGPEEGEKYIVRGVLEKSDSKRFFGEFFLRAEGFETV